MEEIWVKLVHIWSVGGATWKRLLHIWTIEAQLGRVELVHEKNVFKVNL